MSLLRSIQRTLRPLGRHSAARVIWMGAAAFAVWAVLDVMVLHLSHGISLPTYDAMVRHRFHAEKPDPRLLILDIDEASLVRMSKDFGQWPWSRETLATVLVYCERQRPAAIVWDVIFSDPDRNNPGGDLAFDAAAARSTHSHFSVIRLPPEVDPRSQVTSAQLPRLWMTDAERGQPPRTRSTVAVIPPVLPGVAEARLGFNNAYVDADGVLRRFRYAERLADGTVIQSLPMSVLSSLDPEAYVRFVRDFTHEHRAARDELISWRSTANIYPRVSFADVFAVAEGGVPLASMPSFEGRILVVGATATSLHDVHATPLSAGQHGIESLATVIDNLLSRHHMAELPRGFQAFLACALLAAIAAWVQQRGVSSLGTVTFVLPAILLTISYLSLNFGHVFLDLQLSAGLALLYLGALRAWAALQRDYWCSAPSMDADGMATWAVLGRAPWIHHQLEYLFEALRRHAPDCKVVVPDSNASWTGTARWTGLARMAAVIGPAATLGPSAASLRAALAERIEADARAEPPGGASSELLLSSVLESWASLNRRAGSGLQIPLHFGP